MARCDGGPINMANMPLKPPLRHGGVDHTWEEANFLRREAIWKEIHKLIHHLNEDFRTTTLFLISYTF